MLKKEYLIYKLSEAAREACKIDNELFPMYNVKRGLRNEDGSGVLVGLTQVGNVVGYERLPEGGLKAIPGKLFYRGYDVEDLARDFIKEKRFGFEEVAYLLLSGKLPDKEELSAFKELLNDNMPLEQKTKMNILDLEGQNIMNILARSVLEMAGIKNIRTKCLGSRNKQNVVLATIEGLRQLKTPEEVARLRGKSVDEILA